jgi:hypothetical protein
MLRIVDRGLSVLLFLFVCGHTAGSFVAYSGAPMTLLWSLSASVFGFLLVALNLRRTVGRADPLNAWITGFANLAQVALAAAFGVINGKALDPRPYSFVVVAGILAALSFWAARSRSPSLQ